MQQNFEDMEECDDDCAKLPLEAKQARRKRTRCGNMDSLENVEHDDCDGPENLCIKKNQNYDERINITEKQSFVETNDNYTTCNRLGMSLKDICTRNQPTHCRQDLFFGFAPHITSKEGFTAENQKHNESRSAAASQQQGRR